MVDGVLYGTERLGSILLMMCIHQVKYVIGKEEDNEVEWLMLTFPLGTSYVAVIIATCVERSEEKEEVMVDACSGWC